MILFTPRLKALVSILLGSGFVGGGYQVFVAGRPLNMEGADLRGADLRGKNLARARLMGANLSGADLASANLRRARYDDSTLWPAGFKPQGHPLIRVRDEEPAAGERPVALQPVQTPATMPTPGFPFQGPVARAPVMP